MVLARHPFSLRQLQYAVAVAEALRFREPPSAAGSRIIRSPNERHTIAERRSSVDLTALSAVGCG